MTITGLLLAIALTAFIGAGFATMFGATTVRERLFGVAVTAVTLSLLMPLVERVIALVLSKLPMPDVRMGNIGIPGSAVPIGAIALPFVLGHLVLAGVLVHRRLRGPEQSRDAGEIQQARGRERQRLPAGVNGDDDL
jgi:hypothetical protein